MSRRVFITGGASGLGRALAERYARAGARVCIADIHEARGAETIVALRRLGAGAETRTDFVRCDVTSEESLIAARDRVVERWGGVDIVVNNAGVAQAGAIEEVSIDDWQWIIDINLLGVVRGCRVFTPQLKRQGSGHIVNIASMAGLLDVPFMSSYNATKAAVVSLSETLQNELQPDNIGVTVVCPSFFQTNLHESLRTPDPSLRVLVKKLVAGSSITADAIAADVYRAVEERRFHVLPHKDSRVAWMIKRLLPRSLYTAFLRNRTAGLSRAREAARKAAASNP